MELQQEEFNKLKQLDRIEYRQKEDRIIKNYDGIDLNQVLTFIFIGVMGCLILYQLTFAIRFIYLIIFFSYMFLIIFFINILVNFYSIIKKKKKLNELQKEYFKVEVK
jgi:hypothetical protein